MALTLGLFMLQAANVAAEPIVSPKAMPPPRLELHLPKFMPFRTTFSSMATPGYETLRLPTFRAEVTLWESGPLSLSLTSHVQPALELDCTLGCTPMLEQSIGLDARYSLGSLGPVVPKTYFRVKAEQVAVVPAPGSAHGTPPRSSQRLTMGFGGLLDL